VADVSLFTRCYLAINSAVFSTKIEQHQRLTDFVDFGTREGACMTRFASPTRPVRFSGYRSALRTVV
jgi:hypothetical protein